MSDFTESKAAIDELTAAVEAITAENASLKAQLADATSGNPDGRLGDLAKEMHRHAAKLRQSVTDTSAGASAPAMRAGKIVGPMTEAERRAALSPEERKAEDVRRGTPTPTEAGRVRARDTSGNGATA